MSASIVKTRAVTTKADLKTFIDLPYDIYRDEPNWRAPIRLDRVTHVNPAKNPIMDGIDYQFFLVSRDGQEVGRICAFVSQAHQERHSDNAGHFGFFDCAEDDDVAQALLSAAEEWLVSKNVSKIIGPAQWGVNDECGCLIDGFDTPPVILMGYGRPTYSQMIEKAGYSKAVDMLAFQADLHAGYPRPRMTQMMVKQAEKDPRVTWRQINMKDLAGDVEIAMDIFNDAWSENWGFLPYTPPQVSRMVSEMRPVLQKELFWIGMIDEKPAAFITMIPDVNQATQGLDGHIFPFGFAKILYRLKIKGVKQARIPLMGLRREWHNTRQGLALVAQLCETVFAAARDAGYTHCELSWILEDNDSMIRICEQASAKPYKTYRMYEKSL